MFKKESERSTLDARRSTLDARRSTLDARRSTLDARRCASLAILATLTALLTVPGLAYAADSITPATTNAPGSACSPNGALSSSGTGLVVCTSGAWVAEPLTVGAQAAACSSTYAGQIQWTGTQLQYCDGSAWYPFSSSCFGSSTGADTSLASGLVGYWNLNEGAGNIAYDDTVNGNNGTWQGTLGSQWTTGIIGSGGNFSGANDLTAPTANPGTNNFSVAGWVKTTATSQQYFFNKRTNCVHGSFWETSMAASGTTTFCVDQNSSGTNYYCISGSKVINNGNWHFIAFVRSGATIYIYVDGAFDTSGTGSGTANIVNNTALSFGGSDPCGLAVVGQIDEVGVWNVALTSTQVSKLYNSGAGNAFGAMICPAVINSSGGFAN